MSTVFKPSRKEQAAQAEEELLGQVGKRRSKIVRAISVSRFDNIPIAHIRPNPQQPRRDFNEASIVELAQTIRLHGQQQAVLVEQPDDREDEFILIAGERRLQAFQRLVAMDSAEGFEPSDFEFIKAEIRQVRAEDAARTRRVCALIENICRENLNERDTALAFTELREDTHWSWDEIAAYLGMDEARVRRLASLHGQEPVLDALKRRDVTQNQAFALARVHDPELVDALIPVISGLPENTAVHVVSRAKHLDASAPAPVRAAAAVREVVGKPVIGPRPARGTRTMPYSRNGETVQITVDLVYPSRLPLAAMMRMREVERPAFAEALQATCEELDIWPQRPSMRPSRKGRGED